MEGGLLLILAAYLLRIRPVPLAVFSTGFAASALEVILLMGFQIVYGSTYQQVSLIVTMFMIGLAIGSYLMKALAAAADPQAISPGCNWPLRSSRCACPPRCWAWDASTSFRRARCWSGRSSPC